VVRCAVLLLLVACGLPPALAVHDLDGDGFTVEGGGDCDDHDEDVNPSAVESCNRLDDDCDGRVDNGACGDYDPDDDDVPSVLGEDGVGATMVVGRFDGDSLPDLLTFATMGTSPAVCTVAAGRVADLTDQPLSDVANCWLTGASLGVPVVVSAERYGVGLPAGQDIALVTSGASVCAVNPFGTAYTLEEAAYGCVPLTNLPAELQGPTKLLAADRDAGTVAGANDVYLAVLDPVDYLAGASATPAIIQFQSPVDAAENGGDLDGDGVTEMIVGVGTRAYLLSGDIDLTGPVELITPWYVDTAGTTAAVGGAGDLDGDGQREWFTVAGGVVKTWTLTEPFSALSGYRGAATLATAGDFNGDGRDDLWLHAGDAEEAWTGLFLGGTWPAAMNTQNDADLAMDLADGGFGAAIQAAGDRFGDGGADTWFSAPNYAVNKVVRGRLYLVDGWGLDHDRASDRR
jgi:hypothetical protein